ncbi:MAG TPA: hypothetical protein PK052_01585 [Anaerohalosphaeraceae bacterium]|nr:hypothetical protein [Anaerohalosphaeraceae bacterium]HOL30648.1 hypothetical protein [Anaerohalosphaeraceae bacterium]HOM75928.1 hypothetical protein [Anaerohalosphaeraceae bacterium]HPC65054.1 hypothetical protein [Anaerohalosphaeraceae bacterium]HPO70336.1 hypothetical protein [Anaerohalosphaeraceae bacterium]
MKDSKLYSPKLTKLLRSLKRQAGSCSVPRYADPIEAVIYGLICEQFSETAAERIYKRMKSHFVDLNDLRVSRVEEILDVFRDASPAAEHCARAITQVLNAIFDKYDRIALDMLGPDGKRQAHKELSEIKGITPFAVSYCFLTALEGHAVPLNAAMVEYLRKNEYVHPEASESEIAGFLERQIPANDAYTFYMLLRCLIEQGALEKPKSSEKAAASAKTAKKKTAAVSKKTAKKK